MWAYEFGRRLRFNCSSKKCLVSHSEPEGSEFLATKTILVIGKVFYGLEFSISEKFSLLASEESVGSTTVGSDVNRVFGGTAGNVAYGLALLGAPPILVSQVGNDFDWFYRSHMEKHEVEMRLFINPERETACQYKITDAQEKVFKILQDNSYRFLAEGDLDEQLDPLMYQDFTAVFISTGKVEADAKFISTIHNYNKRLPLIYSPDANVHELTKWRLSQIFEKITVLVCTEDELKLIEERMKVSRDEILANTKRLKYLISIHQRSKIVIHAKEIQIKVSEGPAEEILSDDGWQDAFRAGLIYGISLKKPIDEAAKIGSALASYAVETREYQEYSPSLEQVSLRAFEVKTISKNN